MGGRTLWHCVRPAPPPCCLQPTPGPATRAGRRSSDRALQRAQLLRQSLGGAIAASGTRERGFIDDPSSAREKTNRGTVSASSTRASIQSCIF